MITNLRVILNVNYLTLVTNRIETLINLRVFSSIIILISIKKHAYRFYSTHTFINKISTLFILTYFLFDQSL